MPDQTDDVVEIPVADADAANGGTDSPVEENEMDPLIEKLTNQNFVERNTRVAAYSEQYLGNMTLVANMTAQMFALNVQMVNAAALNQLPTGLADKILGFNAAGFQPFNAPTGTPAQAAKA